VSSVFAGSALAVRDGFDTANSEEDMETRLPTQFSEEKI
jgi:hypothetical protein